MEGYRSGHNGVVLKTIRVKAHAGSNPAPSAKRKKRTMIETNRRAFSHSILHRSSDVNRFNGY